MPNISSDHTFVQYKSEARKKMAGSSLEFRKYLVPTSVLDQTHTVEDRYFGCGECS
jgi:hypothetical protein